MTSLLRSLSLLFVVVPCITACGAKTGLRVPDGAVEPMVDAGRPDVPIPPSYLGTEFFAVSTSNSGLLEGNRFTFAVAVGNPSNAAVTVTVTGGALRMPVTRTVRPLDTVTIALPWVTDLSRNEVRVRNCTAGCCDIGCCATADMGRGPGTARRANGAYRIETSAPVTVYQFNPLEYATERVCRANSYTNDASLLLPVTALRERYLVLGARGWNERAFVTIVGTTETPTEISFRTTAHVGAGEGIGALSPGETLNTTLARGEVLQLLSTGGEFTGSEITASARVVVFSGHDCTNISWPENGQGACDHLEEQLFPEATWGNEVIVSQLQDRGPEERSIVRITSAVDDNVLTFVPGDIAPMLPRSISRGQMVEFETQRDFLVRGTGPILVAQFMEGQETTPGAIAGDPAMVLEVPAAQYRTDYAFVVPDTYTASFMNIVAAPGDDLQLDGRSLNFPAEPLPETPWVIYRHPIAPGAHLLRSPTMQPFGLKVLGIAPYTSYAYPGGLDLRNLR